MKRSLTVGATLVSAVGVLMSISAAAERGGTAVDQALIGAVSVAITLACHLLPAISRAWPARALWAACLLLTAWGHAAFFTAASWRAGDSRASAVTAPTQGAALRDELAAIHARPVAVVAADLANAQARLLSVGAALTRCQAGECPRLEAAAGAARARAGALQEEARQAQRASDLRARLSDAAGAQDATRAAAAQDPVARALGSALGLPAESLSTMVSVLSAVVVELLAALLWSLALAPESARAVSVVRSPTAPTATPAPVGSRVSPGTAPGWSSIASMARLFGGRPPARASPS